MLSYLGKAVNAFLIGAPQIHRDPNFVTSLRTFIWADRPDPRLYRFWWAWSEFQQLKPKNISKMHWSKLSTLGSRHFSTVLVQFLDKYMMYKCMIHLVLLC